MHLDEAPKQPKTDCPRCGYDVTVLRPIPSKGKSSVCPECGYEVNWDAVDSDRPVKWFVESERTGKSFLKLCLLTLIRVLRIRPFFEDVQLERPVNLRKAVLWVLVLFLLVQLIFGSSLAVMALLDRAVTPPPSGMGWWSGMMLDEFVGETVTGYTSPLLHVSETTYAPWSASLNWEDWWGRNGGIVAIPVWSSPGSTWEVAVGLAFVPLPTLIVWITIVSAPLLLVCLPWTRKRARVRMAHVVRATLYTCATFLPLLLARVIAAIYIYGWPGKGYRSFSWGGISTLDRLTTGWLVLAALLCTVWTWKWWKTVFEEHWKLEQPLAVWRSLVVIQSLLIGILLCTRVMQWMPHSWI